MTNTRQNSSNLIEEDEKRGEIAKNCSTLFGKVHAAMLLLKAVAVCHWQIVQTTVKHTDT